MSESEILAARLRFYKLVRDLLKVMDEDLKGQQIGGMRPGGPINLDDLGDSRWLEQFRFTRDEVRELAEVLDLPEEVYCSENGVKENRVTALCMLLRRLAYPARLCDIEMQFGWEASRFSRISRVTALFLWDRWKHLLRFDPARLTPEKLCEFGRALAAKGCPIDTIVALIDGTLRRNARPVRNQRILYNGWKRVHCLKYHALLAPDGIVIHVYGPVEGIRHDETILKESGLTNLLQQHFHSPDGTPLYIYGDSGYAVGTQILAPFKGLAITPDELQWNTVMSKVREAVEWIFGEVAAQFPFLDFSRNQKVLLSPCSIYYLVAILFCNAHTILHHPQVPQYFDYPPPSLREYFQGGPIDDSELDAWCLTSPWHILETSFSSDGDEGA